MKLNKNYILLFAFSFFQYFYMIDVIQTIYMQDNGISLIYIGIIYAVYQFSKVVLEIPTGLIGDKYGNKLSVTLGVIFLFISNFILLYRHSFIAFCISSIFQGLSYTMISGSEDALFINNIIINKKYASRLGEILSYRRAIIYSGVFLSAILGGYIASFSIRIIYIITLTVEALSLSCILFVEDKSFEMDKERKVSINTAVKSIINDKLALYLILIDVFIAFSLRPIEKHYYNYLKSLGVSEYIAAWIYGLGYLIPGLIGIYLYKYFVKVFDKRKVLIYGCIMKTIFVVLFGFVPSVIIKFFSYFMNTLIMCTIYPIKNQALHERINKNIRATVLSIQSLFMSIAAILSNYLLGLIGVKFSYSAGIVVVALASFIMIVFCMFNLNVYWIE